MKTQTCQTCGHVRLKHRTTEDGVKWRWRTCEHLGCPCKKFEQKKQEVK